MKKIIALLIILTMGTIGCNTVQKVQEFNQYEQELAEYQQFYTSVMVEYKEKPQDIFMEICEEYPDTCHFKTSDWLFLVEYTNGCNLDNIKPGDYLIVPYLNGPALNDL